MKHPVFLFSLLALWSPVQADPKSRSIAIQNDSGAKVEIYWIHPVSDFRELVFPLFLHFEKRMVELLLIYSYAVEYWLTILVSISKSCRTLVREFSSLALSSTMAHL